MCEEERLFKKNVQMRSIRVTIVAVEKQ